MSKTKKHLPVYTLDELAKGMNEFLEKTRDSLTIEDVRLLEAVIRLLNIDQQKVSRTSFMEVISEIIKLLFQLTIKEDVLHFLSDFL